jgi:ribosomal protein L40E
LGEFYFGPLRTEVFDFYQFLFNTLGQNFGRGNMAPATLLPAFLLGLIFWGGVFGRLGPYSFWFSILSFSCLVYFCAKLGKASAEQIKLWKHLNACRKCHWGTPTLAKHCRYCGEKLLATEKPVNEKHRLEEVKLVSDGGGRCTPSYHLMCACHEHKFCMMCGKNLEGKK